MAMGAKIKGLTVEIGGDTTNLGKALDSVKKDSTALQKELGQVNKLLKFDPENTELLAQKQKILADSIEKTKEKLALLKNAEAQVQAQFAKGEISEAQYRDFQREIIATEGKLKTYQKAAADTADQVRNLGKAAGDAGDGLDDEGKNAKEAKDKTDDFGKAAKDAEKDGKSLGDTLSGALKAGLLAVGAAAAGAVTGLAGIAESTRDYRTDMGKLTSAFETSGFSADVAKKSYQDMQAILGESDQAQEAVNHLAKLCDTQEELNKWTDISAGVFQAFGDSLPIEGLTEAANETAKVGQVTGPLADALNWVGISEDEFNEKLAACSSEQERQQLITETLSAAYQDAANSYYETNAAVMEANRANEALNESLAGVGAAVEPVVTDVKMMAASFLKDLVPGVENLSMAFQNLIDGTGSADAVGVALGGLLTSLLTKVTNMLPAIAGVATSLLTTLTTTIIGMLPQLAQTGMTIIVTLLTGIAQALPEIVPAMVDAVFTITETIIDNLPAVLEAGLQVLEALCQGILDSLPLIAEKLPKLIMTIIDFISNHLPEIIDTGLQILLALALGIVDAIPQMVQQLPRIIIAFNTAIIKALPQILASGVKVLLEWQKGILSKITEIPGVVLKIMRNLIQGFRDNINSVKDVGKNIVKGLWDGIKSMGRWIKNKVTNFFGGIIDSVKGLFGIHSPSKVFAEIGEMLDRGLAEGITDNMNNPIKAMQELSDGLIADASGFGAPTVNSKVTHMVAAASSADSGLMQKIDQLIAAVEKGQVIALDGKKLIGATAETIDNVLGKNRVMAAKGAV